jgi:glycosyltransferase involved in cell wall biosynthesis
MPQEELFREVAKADVAIMLLNRDEPFGYAPIEAVATGLNVIVTKGPGATEEFPRDYPLFIGDREDASEIAKKIHWCAANRRDLPVMADDLRRRLVLKLDLEATIIPSYLRFIESIEAPPGGGFDFESLMAASQSMIHLDAALVG